MLAGYFYYVNFIYFGNYCLRIELNYKYKVRFSEGILIKKEQEIKKTQRVKQE